MSKSIEELHELYKRYYLKEGLKIFLGSIGAVALLTTVYILSQETKEKNLVVDAPSKKPAVRQSTQTRPNPLKVETKVEKVRAKRNTYKVEVSADVLDASLNKIYNKTELLPVKKEQKPSSKHREKVSPKVGESNYFSDLKPEYSLDTWIEKYAKKKTYSTAIYIAKQYYFDKNYKQSGIWAKRANQLDRNKEEAWLYYAKSVFSLGDTVKAKRILNLYLQYKKSLKAELLLSEWKRI